MIQHIATSGPSLIFLLGSKMSNLSIAMLMIIELFSCLKLLEVGSFFKLTHGIVPLCCNSDDIWGSQLGELIFYLYGLAADEQIVGVSWSFGHYWQLVQVLGRVW